MSSQKLYELLLKRLLPVMCLLLFDVSNDSCYIRLADAECTVSPLPGEFGSIRERLVDPVSGVAFDLSDGFGDSDCWRQMGKKVNVIFHSVHRVQRSAELSHDPSEVGKET